VNHPIRDWVEVQATEIFEGIHLEGLPPTPAGHQPGVVLTHRNWKNVYFMRKRKNWKEDEYFDWATIRFQELGIKNP